MKKCPVYFYSLLGVFILPTFIFGWLILDKISIFSIIVFATIIMVTGAIWDTWATKHGFRDRFWLWNFNKKYMLGPKVFGIPIEEYGFFFFGSTFTVTLWELINTWQANPTVRNFLAVIAILSWFVAAVTLPKLKEPN